MRGLTGLYDLFNKVSVYNNIAVTAELGYCIVLDSDYQRLHTFWVLVIMLVIIKVEDAHLTCII